MRVLQPTPVRSEEISLRPEGYPDTLHGMVVGILSSVCGDVYGHASIPAEDPFTLVQGQLAERWRIARFVDRRKPSLSRVSPESTIADIVAERPAIVINGPAA